MYKDLAHSLKTYAPSESDIQNITNRFLDHKFIHSGDNLFGEKYEAWVYEYLKQWSIDTVDVEGYVSKENFTSKSNKGLVNDKNGQILFMDNGQKVAEYDGLFIYKSKIVFVESSVSDLRQYFRKLEHRLIKKRQILVDLFNTEEVYYLVISRPKKRSIVYRSLPNLVLYKLKNPDFESLTISNPGLKLESPKLIGLESISSFSFF